MAEYRTIKMSFWTDPYIEELPTEGKLLYIYLFTCPYTNNIGVMETTIKRISYETAIETKKVSAMLVGMEKDGKIVRDGNIIWLTHFIKHQCSTSPKLLQSLKDMLQNTPSEKIRHAICLRYPHIFECSQKDMQENDTVSNNQDEQKIPYPYPIDTMPIPSAEYGIRNMEDGNIEGEVNNARARAKRSESIVAVINEQPSELIPALTEFVNHRKSMKRPLTAHALRLNIKDLQRLAPNDIEKQRELIEYAIKKGWQAFYLPNDDQGYSSQSHLPKATTVAQQRSLERQMMAQMLLDDRKQKDEETRNADGSRIVAQPDGTELALPPGW